MRPFPRALVLAALGTSVLAGCGGTSTDHPAAATRTPTTAPTSAPSTTTGQATPTTGVTRTSGPTTPLTMLLGTAEVPGLNPAWHWHDGVTSPADSKPFGICAKGSLTDIGATEVLQRTYFPPDDSDDNAGQQIADLPDAKTSASAWSVLKAWHDHCAANAHLTVSTRPLTPVSTTAGDALWYLVSWQPVGDETPRFEEIGLVKNGTLITVLRITNSAKAFSYPAGKEPMVAMVQAAASKLR